MNQWSPRVLHSPYKPEKTDRSESGLLQGVPVLNPTLTKWTFHVAAEGLAQTTIKNRKMLFRQFEREVGVPIETATAEQLAFWLGRPTLQPATRSTHWSALNAFFDWLVRQRIREDNPMVFIKSSKRPRRRPRPCTEGQFGRLIKTSNHEVEAMFLLAGFAGLREFEIAKFHSDQIDVEAQTLTVIGKGGTEYTLPAHERIIRQALRMPRGYWFPSPHKNRAHVCRDYVYKRMRLQMIRCSVPGTPHTMRHYFATQLVRTGANLRIVQELMRHASLQTTQVYTLVTDDEMRHAIDRLAA